MDKHSVAGEPPVRLCNYTDVYKNASIVQGMVFMAATAPPEQIERFRIAVGDTLLTKDSETADDIGVPAYVEYEAEDLICGYHLSIVRPIPGAVEPKFLYWALSAGPTTGQWTVLASGVTRVGIRAGDLAKPALALPPMDEQRAIAEYLDREIARIDTLIEEQQRLIEMFRERRQAVIDASFSTLGEPSVQLRRYIKFLTSGSRGWGDYYADQGERFLRIGNLPRANLQIRGDIQLVDLPAAVTEGSRTMLREGDLLFSITAYLGSVAVIDGDWVGAYVSQHVALCRLERDRVDPRFIGWFMLTTTGQDQLNEGAAGGTKMQLALDDIRGLRVPTAPIEQQRRIASHLDRQTAKIDALVAETERFIELARERRAALITAAVTGQIDVREMV
ncbi:restriction endonuclease subunit S [Herbihabitans rhizosphaerae]|uniref:restriction endonuclease subunit S n=1 Tax=Herbihabitans rhizosphaerae TaxID=1872711 RepID=UPI0013EEE4C7|nr:restriction endonuclease subunit S [Herbihabitans rhizosphaerae]